jgi:hypothetical protein
MIKIIYYKIKTINYFKTKLIVKYVLFNDYIKIEN